VNEEDQKIKHWEQWTEEDWKTAIEHVRGHGGTVRFLYGIGSGPRSIAINFPAPSEDQEDDYISHRTGERGPVFQRYDEETAEDFFDRIKHCICRIYGPIRTTRRCDRLYTHSAGSGGEEEVVGGPEEES
jgi:hypothetical protein